MPRPSQKALTAFILFALTLAILAIFGQLRNFDFISYDDMDYVSANAYVLSGLTFKNFAWAFTTPHVGNWLPLTWLSFMVDCSLFGSNPGLMHFENVLLHLVNTLLLFAVLKTTTGSLWPSAFVAALFAVHPMHVESVAWITERKDVLSTFFFLLTLCAYLGYIRNRGLLLYLLAILLFALGLLAKPMLVTLPLLLLLIDYWPLDRFNAPQPKVSQAQNRQPALSFKRPAIPYRILIEKIPFFVLSIASSIITYMVQNTSGAINIFTLKTKVANALLAYSTYIGKLFVPRNLTVFYPLDPAGISFFQIAFCALLLVFITLLVIRFGRRQKYLPVGWFWFIITLVPVIGLVQSGAQALADRYTYVSYIGLFIIIAWGLRQLTEKMPYRNLFLGLSMPIVIAVFAVCAHRQASCWQNTLTLFSHAARVTQNNYVAYNNLGIAYGQLGRPQQEIEAYKEAIRIYPSYDEAYSNLGAAYGEKGRFPEAIQALRQAIKINPNYGKAYENLGLAYGKLGRYQEQIEAFKQVIRINPNYTRAYYILAETYFAAGKYSDSIETYRQAIKTDPDNAESYNLLGTLFGRLGLYQEAVYAFTKAIQLNPDYIDARKNLALAYSKLGHQP